MPLTKCEVCGKGVSTASFYCQHCGNPITEKPIKVVQGYKTATFVGGIIAVVGLLTSFAGVRSMVNGGFNYYPFGLLILIVGIVINQMGRIGEWWNRK
jgi:hypothetical protein